MCAALEKAIGMSTTETARRSCNHHNTSGKVLRQLSALLAADLSTRKSVKR
jgi:hypothetical protein